MSNSKGDKMAVMKDYKCAKHGFFEGRSAKCPMKDCQEEVMVVFLQAPHHVSSRTKLGDKALEGLAKDFKMGDIKSAGIGENQGNLMSRNNKFTKKQYAEAEAHLLRKTSNGEVPREPRPGDAAMWGGGMNGMNLQSLLTGRMVQSIKGESVGLTPQEAGIKSGPTIDPKSTMRDPDNLKIKT